MNRNVPLEGEKSGTGRRKGQKDFGTLKSTSEWLEPKCEKCCLVVGVGSSSPRTARHCWDPDCFMYFPGKNLSISSGTGEEKKRIIG